MMGHLLSVSWIIGRNTIWSLSSGWPFYFAKESIMLYQLSLLTTFYDILAEQKSCPCKEYASIVDFLNSLARKMLKKMKKQPLLFVEILFWKTRREWHYINAEYMLDELGHLRKETKNWNDTRGDGEIGSSPVKARTHRSIADALGDDEADVVIYHDTRYENNGVKLGDVKGFASTSGSKNGRDVNNGEPWLEDESQTTPRRKKKLVLDAELDMKIKNLYEKQKRKRVSAFNEDQEALIKVLYEQ